MNQDIDMQVLEKLQKVQDKIDQVKINQDSLLEKLMNLRNTNTTDFENDLTAQTLSQEELQNKFTAWELSTTKNIEALNKEFKELKDELLKEFSSQLFAQKKRLAKTEESLLSMTEMLTVMKKWKQKKDYFLWIDFALMILIGIKLLFM